MVERNGIIFLGWEEAFQAGSAVAGGKGWNLGRLSEYGFPVPRGGVLQAAAYREFIDFNSLGGAVEEIAGRATAENIADQEILRELEHLRERITKGTIPPGLKGEIITGLERFGLHERPLAVRSSATSEDSERASFAGIHQSFLNVAGPDSIFEAVKGCYASLWTPGAVTYRRKMGIPDDEVVPAVVIMEMVEARSAGIAFSCDPRTGREDMVVISANHGLGDPVVGGRVDPDQYSLRFDLGMIEIMDKKIGRREGITVPRKGGGTVFLESSIAGTGGPHRAGQADPVLADEEIIKLGLLVLRAFSALGEGARHQDLEWVFDGDFYLVQARPVTALPRYTYPALKGQPDIWSNANFRDSAPMALSTSMNIALIIMVNNMFRATLQMAGYMDLPGLQYARIIQGRAYLNTSLQQLVFNDAFGITPGESNSMVGGHQPEIKVPKTAGWTGWKKMIRKLRLLLHTNWLQKNKGEIFQEIRRYCRLWHQKNWPGLSGRELIAEIVGLFGFTLEAARKAMLLNGLASFSFSALTASLEKIFPGRGHSLANALLTGAGSITSADHGYRLLDLAVTAREDPEARLFFISVPFLPLRWEEGLPEGSTFKHAFRAFLEEFGHRAVYEIDQINPRWREDPSYLLFFIKSVMNTADPSGLRSRQKEKREHARREIDRKAPFYRRGAIKWWAARAVRGAELREAAKSELIRLGGCSRVLTLEIGRRLVERGILEQKEDVFHCSFMDLASILEGHWDGRGLKKLVAHRKIRRKQLEALAPPDLIIDEAPRYAPPAGLSCGNYLEGLGVASGRASGKARLLKHPDEGGRLAPGEVLVAPSTDPGWTPLFLKACALVMETGGSLSHGAIVAREFGVPAVVNVPGAMRMIADGHDITVDGDEGRVFL